VVTKTKLQFEKGNKRLKNIFFSDAKTIKIFTVMAGISFGCEKLLYMFIIDACNDDDSFHPLILFFGANSLFLGATSLIVFVYVVFSFTNDYRRAHHHNKSGRNEHLTYREMEMRHQLYFRYVINEIINIIIATSAIGFLGAFVQPPEFLHQVCANNMYEKLAKLTAWVNYIYVWLCAIVSFLLVYFLFVVWAVWIFRRYKNFRRKRRDFPKNGNPNVKST
jgi:hypothetical protein